MNNSHFIKQKFDFSDLFIFDMANNHKGQLDLGRQIVSEFGKVAREAGVRAAIKFQFRHLDSLIHPSHKQGSQFEYIPYFQKNSLTERDYEILVSDIKNQGLLSMATPYEEESVEMIERLGVDIVKIASSSATDWPLLQRVAETGKPVVVSTAGLAIEQIDNIVSFFEHRGVDFAILHCVAIYPTPAEKLNLNRIALLRDRYPEIVIGFSTHENPDNLEAVKVAYAKGARIFERHIGIETETQKLNSYSSRPEQIKKWIEAYHMAMAMSGSGEVKDDEQEEAASLQQFQRGVYTNRFIKAGAPIHKSDVFFAMPLVEGQLKSGDFSNPVVADRDYAPAEALSVSLQRRTVSKKHIIYKAIHQVKGMLNAARIYVNYDSNVELSHHKGLESFFQVGAFIIDCINREYCKKIIVMLKGQVHPSHYHKKKEETFQILSGELQVEIEGRVRTAQPGDTLLIPRGVWHSFYAPNGAIFEEISTTHFNDDSFYSDKEINRMGREGRKTKLINWGRHQFDDLKEDENKLEIKPL